MLLWWERTAAPVCEVLKRFDSRIDALQKTTASDLDSSFQEIQPALKDFVVSADTLSRNFPPIMTNLVDTSKSASVSSANLAATTDSAKLTMQQIQKAVEYEVHELMKPVSKVKAGFLFTVKAVGVFLGY